jgi:hypothetical protein
MQRLPTQKMSVIGELLPHRWQPASSEHMIERLRKTKREWNVYTCLQLIVVNIVG